VRRDAIEKSGRSSCVPRTCGLWPETPTGDGVGVGLGEDAVAGDSEGATVDDDGNSSDLRVCCDGFTCSLALLEQPWLKLTQYSSSLDPLHHPNP
jgi:hypothetical protein